MASTTTIVPSSNVSREIGVQNQRPEGDQPLNRTSGDIREVRTPQQGGTPRGGRGRGRGQRGNRANGRGNQNGRYQANGVIRPSPPKPPTPDLGGGGISGGHSTRDAGSIESAAVQAEQQDDAEDEVEAEVCFICASPVIHNSVAPCNHRTCHICALRLRALYKTRACAHCRVSPAVASSQINHYTDS